MSSAAADAKCSRSAKHETSHDGETGTNSHGKTGDDLNKGPPVNGTTGTEGRRSPNESISGSRQSLRSNGRGVKIPDEDALSGTSLRSSSSHTAGGDGSQRSSSSRASSARHQRPKTSVRARSARQSSAGSRSTTSRVRSSDRSSLSSRQSYDDEFDIASLTDAHDFSQYVDVVRQESSRLSMREESPDSDPGPLDVSLLHSVLADLSLSLKDSEARSLRIFEDIEEVREATVELKRTLVVKMGQEDKDDQQSDGDQKEASRALATARAAKAALAELALEVAEASKMAAEAEKAAAEAAALAEEVANQVDATDKTLKEYEDTEDERQQKAKEEAERQEEEEKKRQEEENENQDKNEEEIIQEQDEEPEQKPESDEENKKDAVTEKQDEKLKVESPVTTPRAKENPLDWPYYPLNITQDGEEFEDDIGCILRYNIDNFPLSPKFQCSLVTTPSDTLLCDSEELVSDVVCIERVDEQGGDKLETPIVVAVPYTSNARMVATREFVVKFLSQGEDQEWKVIPTLSTEGSYKEMKTPFAECRVTRIGTYAVVARLSQDRLTISKKGGMVKSSADNRVTITYPPKACTLISVTLRVQPAESVVTELKERMRHCSDLISASPIIHMTHSTKKPFEKPVTLTIPCPPNPHKSTTPGVEKSKSEKSRSHQEFHPEGTVVIRATKSSIFGGDPSNDSLHVLFRQGNSAVWNEMEDVEIKQVRKDVVSLEIEQPVDRLVVLRMTAEPRYPIQNVTSTFEKALQIKYANIILQHREDDPQQIAVLCVPTKQLENALRRLSHDGYEAQADPSPDIPMTEGQEITLRFNGNIKIIGHEELKFTFYSHKRNLVDFAVEESNRFGNYSSTEYRGMAEFYGMPKISLEDMEDPEEVLLKEAEAKAAEKENKGDKKDEKKGKGQKGQDKDKNKEQGNTETSQRLLCKIPVALPKAEPDPPLPPSRYRTTAIDIGGIVSNTNLKWLSTELGNEWESLAAYLGIKKSRLQSIKRNNPNKQGQQILDMLITWRSQCPKSYDKERKICSALTRCGRYDLAEELRYREEEFEENDD